MVCIRACCGDVRGVGGVTGRGGVVGVKLRPLVVIPPPVLLPLLLQVLQLGFVHHLLHQVLLPPHAVAQVLGHVRNEVRDEGLDPEHQVLGGREAGREGGRRQLFMSRPHWREHT